jgi:hypothetical protein
LLKNPDRRAQLAQAGHERSALFAWENVATEVLAVYEMALVGNSGISLESDSRVWNRFRGGAGQ